LRIGSGIVTMGELGSHDDIGAHPRELPRAQ
jgi:hypothetical protein